MKIFYAKSSNGFYVDEIHGSKIPSDAVEITKGKHSELLAGQLEGMVIVSNDSGFPFLEDLPVTPYVPKSVSRAQGKAVLITAGLWPDVLAFVESITDPTEKALAEVALNDTTHWRRDSPTMQAISSALGITGEQMDDLFIQAADIAL